MTLARFCPSCGSARIEDARFCGGCGADLEAPGVSPGPVSPVTEPHVPPVVQALSLPPVARPAEVVTAPVAGGWDLAEAFQ
jgi:hypothetical protein